MTDIQVFKLESAQTSKSSYLIMAGINFFQVRETFHLNQTC